MDDFLKDDRTRIQPVHADFIETDKELIWTTSAVKLVFGKNPLGFRLYNSEGSLLYADREGQPYTFPDNIKNRHSNRTPIPIFFLTFNHAP